MQTIALPKKFEIIKSDNPNIAQIVIEPCYPGYGTTLGNALRRVLLSSLPGAAVIGIKINGVDHEFMSLPHIKEDVLNIILNLKKLRIKVYTDNVVKLNLDVYGEKTVTASDISKNSDVEIVNPELVIANITDMAGKLNMEIYVSRGLGYETIENRENKNKEIGYIEMDSIFSPILNVGINIENVRVGKMTNWDKLILDIKTDGTISPEEAFKKAVAILLEQFSALLGKSEEIFEDNKLEAFDLKNKEEKNKEENQEVKENNIEILEDKKKRGRPKKKLDFINYET